MKEKASKPKKCIYDRLDLMVEAGYHNGAARYISDPKMDVTPVGRIEKTLYYTSHVAGEFAGATMKPVVYIIEFSKKHFK